MILSLVVVLLGRIDYDPLVDSLAKAVSEDALVLSVASLTGETQVTIAGEPDTLTCRYAYSSDSYKAARWLTEQLEARGVSAETVPFIPLSLHDMDLLPTGEGWACGYEAFGKDVLHTSDGGVTWHAPESEPRGIIWVAVEVISKDSVWLLDRYGGVTRMVDGENWEDVGPSGSLYYDMFALSSCQGWVVGDSGMILSTRDAWETWEENRVVDGDLRHVCFDSENQGWIASKSGLWKTDDGESWTYLEHPMAEISGLSFTDSLHGYIVGRSNSGYGAVYATYDGGSSWSFLIDTLKAKPSTIKVTGTDNIWVAVRGFLLNSIDGGDSWSQIALPSTALIAAVDFSADGRGCAVGKEEVLYSSDSDQWDRVDTSGLGLMWNVSGTLKGWDSQQILITAHYDVFGEETDTGYVCVPGADDNASGTAAVLEAARVLSGHVWEHTLKFLLFTAEEVGMYGSNRYATEAAFSGDSIFAFLNADMIGYDGNADRKLEAHAYTGYDSRSKAAGDIFGEVIDIYGMDLALELDNEYYQAGDGQYLWRAGIPGLSIIEDHDDFNPYYHSSEDRLDKLDTDYLTEVTKACVGWMATMAELDSLVDVKEPMKPTAEIVSLKISSSILCYAGWLEVSSPHPVTPQIYDVTGRKVKTLASLPASREAVRIPLEVSDLPSGVYWIAVQGEENLVSERFVLVR